MRLDRLLIAVAAVSTVTACTRSGGGGSSYSTTAPAAVTTSAGTAAPTTSSSVDAAIQAALASAGVTPLPAAVPDSPELVALGNALFFDKILSGNQNISCASCHQINEATGDGLPVSMGEGATGDGANRTLGTGQLIARNAPALFNAGLPGMNTLFWDGRVQLDPTTSALLTPDFLLNGPSPGRPLITAELTSALAAQALFPETVNTEMLGQPGDNPLANQVTDEDIWSLIMGRLVGTSNGTVGGLGGYRTLFAAAFPSVASFDDFTIGHVGMAIAAFERATFSTESTAFDRYLAGDPTQLTDGQKAGALIFFGKGNCSSCHNGPFLSDLQFHALAVPQLGPGKFTPDEDLGLALITGLASDNYKFRTPPLRNVAATGPWMHDGAFTTLQGAVVHHLDPATSIQNYDPSQLPPLFAATVDTDPQRIAARIAAIDPLLGAPVTLTSDELGNLVDFLNTLTDPASMTRIQSVTPNAVPSGLPVPD